MCYHFSVLIWKFHLTSSGKSKMLSPQEKEHLEGILFTDFPLCETVWSCKIQSSWPLYLPSLIPPSSTYSPSVWTERNPLVFFRRVFQNFSDDVVLVSVIEPRYGMEREIGLPKEVVGRIGCVRMRHFLGWTRCKVFADLEDTCSCMFEFLQHLKFSI